MLRHAGLKITATRIAVVDALAERPHADADDLYGIVARTLPGTSRQAMYAVLAAFTGAGVVRRIEPAGSSARFELRVEDNHHHVVCTRCGTIADIDCVHGEAPCLTPSNSAGFAIDTAEVTFWGVCPKCLSGSVA